MFVGRIVQNVRVQTPNTRAASSWVKRLSVHPKNASSNRVIRVCVHSFVDTFHCFLPSSLLSPSVILVCVHSFVDTFVVSFRHPRPDRGSSVLFFHSFVKRKTLDSRLKMSGMTKGGRMTEGSSEIVSELLNTYRDDRQGESCLRQAQDARSIPVRPERSASEVEERPEQARPHCTASFRHPCLLLSSLPSPAVILAHARIQGWFLPHKQKRPRPWIPDRGRG